MVFTLSAAALIVLLFAAVLISVKRCEKSDRECKNVFNKNDIITVCGLCVLSAVLLFSSLGDKSAPETSYNISESPVAMAFDTPTMLEYIMVYPTGNSVNGHDEILVSFTDESGSVKTKEISDFNVYTWCPVSINDTVSRLVVHTEKGDVSIGEIGFVSDEKVLKADSGLGTVYVSDVEGFKVADFNINVFDEQSLVPLSASYMNGMYFDEIFHSRTAKEYIDSVSPYEWTHPPLGKIIISAGIRLFGMNPFGWRFFGAVFGILSAAGIYIFAKLITKSSLAALLAGAFTVFDFMHHVQSRIGTVDVFLVFFIILMYMFLYMALQKERVGYIPLLISGISFGLAFSVKWSAAYAALGAGVMLLFKIFEKDRAMKDRLKLIGYLSIVFVFIPICIYILSYIPFVSSDGSTGLAAIMDNQKNILGYHGDTAVGVSQEFASRWYTWVLDIKPVLYYSAWEDACTVGAISVFGNPVIWWSGIICVIANVYFAVRKDKNALFLVAGYFSNLLPWALIARPTYIYHYFPSTVFMVLMIANCFVHIRAKSKKISYGIFGTLLVTSVFVFFMFFPAIRAVVTDAGYINGYLELLPSWNLFL